MAKKRDSLKAKLESIFQKHNVTISDLKKGYYAIQLMFGPTVYIKRLKNGRYKLSDFGDTLFRLQVGGTQFQKGKIKEKILHEQLDSYKVQLSHRNKELFKVVLSKDKIPEAMQELVFCMIHISDIGYFDEKKFGYLKDY